MSFIFIYESENKKLKSFEKRDDLVLKEVRFQKKFPKVKLGKIGRDHRHLSTLIIPIPNSEVNFYYNSCEIKISQNGLLKIKGKIIIMIIIIIIMFNISIAQISMQI